MAGLLDQFAGVKSELRAAWGRAEDATIAVLRGAIAELADTWSRFGRHFHAFKPGGLVTNRADLEILNDDGEVVDPVIAIWMRKKDEPQAHGNTGTTVDVDAVAARFELHAKIAFDVLRLVIATRLGHGGTGREGPPSNRSRPHPRHRASAVPRSTRLAQRR